MQQQPRLSKHFFAVLKASIIGVNAASADIFNISVSGFLADEAVDVTVLKYSLVIV